MNMFKPSEAKSVKEYLDLIEEPRKSEVKKLLEFIEKTIPDMKPYFASNMIGFGSFHYKSSSGKEGEWPLFSLASQKNYISIYICASDSEGYVAEKYKSQLPKASIGKSCIRVKKFEDISLPVLKKVILEGVKVGGLKNYA